ncbi:MAG: DUF3108 domain-containing protein [bacterium]|nr:MAG: DUF3108 domain-containing protein [bacterium]
MKFIWLISFISGLIKFDGIESTANPNFIGEQLVFKMEYLNLSVATLNFQTIGTNKNNYHLKVHANATRSARLLFKLDNVYETYFNRNTFLPIKVIKKIQQKNIQHELNIYFDYQKNKASLGDSISWLIPGDCFDYFSMLYFLRAQALRPGEIIHFHLDSEYLISKVEVKVLSDQEIIQVPAGKFQSIKLNLKFSAVTHEPRPWRTDLLTNRLAAPGSEITIWFSNDNYQLPLKISYHQSKIKTQLVLDSFSRGQQH